MSGRCVLIADDVDEARMVVRAHLERHYDCNVLEAGDGIAAAAELFARSASLLITDIDMPRMGGIELLALVRRSPRLAAMPVVMLTLRDSPDERERAHRFGANAFLLKPFAPGALGEAMRALGWHPLADPETMA